MSYDNIYYVYAYEDMDTREVFYVGMGKGRRAYDLCKSSRNKYFLEYYNTHKCRMFFIKKDISKEEADRIETECVMYYHEHGECYANSTYNGKNTGPFGERNGNYGNGEKLKNTYKEHPELKYKTKHVGLDNGRATPVYAIYKNEKIHFSYMKEAAQWLINSGISHGTLANAQSAISQAIKHNKRYCGVSFKLDL